MFRYHNSMAVAFVLSICFVQSLCAQQIASRGSNGLPIIVEAPRNQYLFLDPQLSDRIGAMVRDAEYLEQLEQAVEFGSGAPHATLPGGFGPDNSVVTSKWIVYDPLGTTATRRFSGTVIFSDIQETSTVAEVMLSLSIINHALTPEQGALLQPELRPDVHYCRRSVVGQLLKHAGVRAVQIVASNRLEEKQGRTAAIESWSLLLAEGFRQRAIKRRKDAAELVLTPPKPRESTIQIDSDLKWEMESTQGHSK